MFKKNVKIIKNKKNEIRMKKHEKGEKKGENFRSPKHNQNEQMMSK